MHNYSTKELTEYCGSILVGKAGTKQKKIDRIIKKFKDTDVCTIFCYYYQYISFTLIECGNDCMCIFLSYSTQLEECDNSRLKAFTKIFNKFALVGADGEENFVVESQGAKKKTDLQSQLQPVYDAIFSQFAISSDTTTTATQEQPVEETASNLNETETQVETMDTTNEIKANEEQVSPTSGQIDNSLDTMESITQELIQMETPNANSGQISQEQSDSDQIFVVS